MVTAIRNAAAERRSASRGATGYQPETRQTSRASLAASAPAAARQSVSEPR